jgi:hypothetical protein
MPTAEMVFVVLALSTPVPMERCEALKAVEPQTICVQVEPDCGNGTGPKCKGEVDMKPDYKPKKRTVKYRSKR